MGNMSAFVRLVLNMPVHMGHKVSVHSYSKVKRIPTPSLWMESGQRPTITDICTNHLIIGFSTNSLVAQSSISYVEY